jgi:hypothetical protein
MTYRENLDFPASSDCSLIVGDVGSPIPSTAQSKS